MQFCKYCNQLMYGENETLSSNEYNFFYVCHNCGSIFEGKMRESKNEKVILKQRWFNPNTKEIEEIR